MGNETVPEKRINKNGHVVTKHVNPNKRPVDSFQRGLQELAHLVARTSFDGAGHTKTSVHDDPVALLLKNPSHIVALDIDSKNRQRFTGIDAISLALSTGTVMVTTTHSRRAVDIASDFVAREGNNDDPALIADYLQKNADRLNKKFEKRDNNVRVVPTGDSLSIIQMAPIHESVADLDTWDDIYGVASEKGLLGTKRDIENSGVSETIRGFIKASKRFSPNRFRRLA